MLKIELREFIRLRRMLNLRNLDRFSYPKPTLSSILSQKIVERVKARHPIYVKRLNEIAEYWKEKGKLPRWFVAPPTIKAKLLMKALGFTKSEIRRYTNNPDLIEDENLRRLVWKANVTDFIYSPIATKFHHIKGRIGEEIVQSRLESLGVEYLTEDELRKRGGKTPDFLLEKPLKIDGFEVKWIESKAMFGDPSVHSQYWRRQYYEYLKRFGRGTVVYWFGHVEGLFLASTGYEFGCDRLLNMNAHLSDDGMDIGEPFSREFVNNMLKLIDLFYEGEKIVIKPNRWAVNILSRLGFRIIADDDLSDR